MTPPADDAAVTAGHTTRLDSGVVLPTLLWSGSDPLDPAAVQPAGQVRYFSKPSGGLWTSPADPAAAPLLSNWWISGLGRDRSALVYVVQPDPATRLYVIDSLADLHAARRRWPHRSTADEDIISSLMVRRGNPVLLDWPAAACDVDAVYLTEPGQQDTADADDLWGWDGPTVLFLNPTFTADAGRPAPTTAQLAEVEQRRRAEIRAEVFAAFAEAGQPVPGLIHRLFQPTDPCG